MNHQLLIKNARIVNERSITYADVKIKNQRIDKIAPDISAQPYQTVIDLDGDWLLPGMIDDQVHFREPGLTHKGSIFTESRAAAVGGITSFMEMPNVKPSTTTIDALRAKHDIASRDAFGNYSFYLGATPDNIEEIKRVDPSWVCGVKVFMGASTGDLLVEHPEALERIFRDCPSLIVTHCENGAVIAQNLEKLKQSRSSFNIHDHPIIRDHEACYASSSYAVDLAKRYNSQLHVLHLTTEKEMSLFEPGPVVGKSITAEACVHHLWFSDEDYGSLGNLIKCNPAIKQATDREALFKALNEGRIDIIATDHAPHTFEEKQADFMQAPAGLPLVQDALLSVLEHTKIQRLSMLDVVEKVSHNPAIRYAIKDRGFVREGYYADLVAVSDREQTTASDSQSRYKCGWTPFHGVTFSHKIKATIVNGHIVYDGFTLSSTSPSMALEFNR